MPSWTVVTGGGSGIGAAICRRLAEDGHHVVVTDIDESAAQRVSAGIPGSLARRVDVALATDADAVAEEAVATGGLGAWVSNAGVSHMARFVDVTEDELDWTVSVNIKGVFLCGQAAARAMKRGGGGVIVNIASTVGRKGGVPFLSDYIASKFAVVGLTQAMAVELGSDNVRVNCVCPGYVATGMQSREIGWEAALRGVSTDEVRDLYIADTPLGRIQKPEDVAPAVAFLVSDRASFITGETLVVNGGSLMY